MRSPSLLGTSVAALAVLGSLEALLLVSAGGVVAHPMRAAAALAETAPDSVLPNVTTIVKLGPQASVAGAAKIRVVLASPYASKQFLMQSPAVAEEDLNKPQFDGSPRLAAAIVQKGDFGSTSPAPNAAETAVAENSASEYRVGDLSDLRLASR